jgi:hypothetical protein
LHDCRSTALPDPNEKKKNMSILRLAFPLLCLALLAGCASTREITDFRNTSIVYGWVNMSEAPSPVSFGQALHLNPKDKYAYFNFAVQKFEGGYLFYHYGMDGGNYRLHNFGGQNCLLIFCSNTVHRYLFGEDSDYAFTLGKPGVYFLGAWDYRKVKTRFFEQGKFDFVKAKKPPTRRQMLEHLLKQVEKDDSKEFAPALGRLRAETARR